MQELVNILSAFFFIFSFEPIFYRWLIYDALMVEENQSETTKLRNLSYNLLPIHFIVRCVYFATDLSGYFIKY